LILILSASTNNNYNYSLSSPFFGIVIISEADLPAGRRSLSILFYVYFLAAYFANIVATFIIVIFVFIVILITLVEVVDFVLYYWLFSFDAQDQKFEIEIAFSSFFLCICIIATFSQWLAILNFIYTIEICFFLLDLFKIWWLFILNKLFLDTCAFFFSLFFFCYYLKTISLRFAFANQLTQLLLSWSSVLVNISRL
jgi:hypothetical protein